MRSWCTARSRFFRELFEFVMYERLLKRVGVKVVPITQENSDDTAGEMVSNLFSLFDEYPSKENAKHTQRGMHDWINSSHSDHSPLLASTFSERSSRQ